MHVHVCSLDVEFRTRLECLWEVCSQSGRLIHLFIYSLTHLLYLLNHSVFIQCCTSTHLGSDPHQPEVRVHALSISFFPPPCSLDFSTPPHSSLGFSHLVPHDPINYGYSPLHVTYRALSPQVKIFPSLSQVGTIPNLPSMLYCSSL